MRRLWMLFLCAGLGCQSMQLPGRNLLGDLSQNSQSLREQGQLAMSDGDTSRALYLFVKSMSQEHFFGGTQLKQAAASLEKGAEGTACDHLEQYLREHPEHAEARFCCAELLFKMGSLAPARNHFAQLIERCPDTESADLDCLLHCHGRLMEIAEATEDEYCDHLHRGIGMFLLATKPAPIRFATPIRNLAEEAAERESLLCKALVELNQAQELRPNEARTAWYLHEVTQSLGQRRPAQRFLRLAQENAAFSYLTPAEQRHLALTVSASASFGHAP
jgi:tetratricopeptide (TPR) repeat protein